MRTPETLLSRIRADAAAHHRHAHPGPGGSGVSQLAVALGSRGFLVLVVHRLAHANSTWRPVSGRERLLERAASAALSVARYVTTVLAKSQIGRDCEIGGGVALSDRGHVIIGARSIGAGTVIGERVTIGKRAGDSMASTPVVGEHVWIGASAVIYGDICVGDGATILPGSVVSRNVPPRALVGGYPASIVRREFDNSRLLESAAGVDVQAFIRE